MKSSRLLLAVTTLALAFLFTWAVPTASAARIRVIEAPETPVDTRKLVESVNVAGGTIDIEIMRDKTTHTYKIDGGTVITVNNDPGKIGDIKVGMEVIDFVERSPQVLDSISLRSPESAP